MKKENNLIGNIITKENYLSELTITHEEITLSKALKLNKKQLGKSPRFKDSAMQKILSPVFSMFTDIESNNLEEFLPKTFSNFKYVVNTSDKFKMAVMEEIWYKNVKIAEGYTIDSLDQEERNYFTISRFNILDKITADKFVKEISSEIAVSLINSKTIVIKSNDYTSIEEVALLKRNNKG